ncbi:hypothetical protein [Methylobacterium nonmethylotrophicum]|uniref:hypothetical protein n=1 Tax=Methylobacterium nonmethylotrophicum TaxID=1141884 RepID=UPI00197C8C7E|nr:hypothetical protein [Methylobacterium nonmethylotrophicum]
MVVARVILMSAMLTVGIIEVAKTPAQRAVEATPAALPVTAPTAGSACTGATWPYLPESCLRPGTAPRDGEPRRPVRVIEEQRPAAPVRVPGRVSVG